MYKLSWKQLIKKFALMCDLPMKIEGKKQVTLENTHNTSHR